MRELQSERVDRGAEGRERAAGAVGDVRRVWGGTFHRIANLILRKHAVSIGYASNYSILDAEDAKDFINVCIDEAGVDIVHDQGAPLSLVRSRARASRRAVTRLARAVACSAGSKA